jgi:lysophospholipase L1-like esterase
MTSRVPSRLVSSSLRLARFALLLLPCALLIAADPVPGAKPAPPDRGDPAVAAPKEGNAGFFKMHEAFLERGKQGNIDLLFLGDSITQGWSKAPEVWKEFYEKYHPANFGIGGDRTEHVLWRIEKGELDGIKPKVVVLMIGTNNSGLHTAAQIAAADRKIVEEIRRKLPQTKVLLLAIFPRGPRKGSDGSMDDGVERMKKIDAVNAELAKLDDGKTVRYLNINEKFLVDGKIPNDVMPDQLHPNAKGYRIWAEAMQPLLDEMMK